VGDAVEGCETNCWTQRDDCSRQQSICRRTLPFDLDRCISEFQNCVQAAENARDMCEEAQLITSPTNASTITCQNGRLVVSLSANKKKRCKEDQQCTTEHEEAHIADWKSRYGPYACNGVPDGQLPVDGTGYGEFLRLSECNAFEVGKACRERFLKLPNCPCRKTLEKAIRRDKRKLREYGCP